MRHRQYVTYLIILVFAGLFSCANPTSSNGSEYAVTISGTVVNLSATPLDSVHIVLWTPFQQDTGKSNGTFSISFQASDKTTVNDSITFSRAGWYSLTKYFTYSSSSATISLGAVALKGLTGAQDSTTATTHASQRAGQIVFLGSSTDNLSILGAGGPTATILTFEVRDSLGTPVDTSNSVSVDFKFINQPDALTQLNLDSVRTNSSGQVAVQLSSGYKAGLATVEAYAAVKDKSSATGYDTIASQIVSIPIYGGYPDSSHLSIGSTLFNVPGGVIINFQDKVSVLVGDKYGNPVHPGTPVYFTSTGGSIEAQGLTDNDGIASATLFTGNPVPSNGFAWIYAQVATLPQSGSASSSTASTPIFTSKNKKYADGVTFNRTTTVPKPLANHIVKFKPASIKAGTVLTDSTPILFSGRTIISTSNNNFVIPVGLSTTVNYTVSDINGNPLTGGSTVSVSATGSASSSVTMTGDITVNIPDTQDKRFTQYQVNLKDNRTTGTNVAQPVSLTISVTSQNGNSKLVLGGTLSSTQGGGPDSSIVSHIVLSNPSTDSIYVTGVGGMTTDVAKFKVYNTFGQPAKNVAVNFKIVVPLGGGEYLSPATALTDTGGNVQTTLTSGTKYGEVLITASTTKDSITQTSDPKIVYIVVPSSARLASQVQYLGATATDIYVDGVGALENSTIGYQVTDSLGIPIDRTRRVGVTYNIQFFPNSTIAGGTPPSVIPATDSTDDNGQLHTTVISGSEAGVVQVVAHISVPNRGTLISQPVKITVHAGFPEQAHFSLIPSHYVVAGFNNKIPFTVEVGDTFSNPVAKGTAVYFHSQSGVIETGSQDFNAYTQIDGSAIVSLLLVNPLPYSGQYEYKPGIFSGLPYASLINGRDGYFWVTAQTQGHFNTNVSDSVLEVEATNPIVLTGVPDTVVPMSAVSHTTAPISVTIKDGNGNPLPDGTTISATIVPPANPPSGFQIGVSGDISNSAVVSLPDAAYARFPGPGITDFTFQVVNSSVPPAVATGVTVTVIITIASPNIGTVSFTVNALAQ